eukprot:m.1477041 g.1477041  ORF g.1477041 m.1477041 type:complete len:341 (-) comp25160_c0_seq7:2104-3126(-)
MRIYKMPPENNAATSIAQGAPEYYANPRFRRVYARHARCTTIAAWMLRRIICTRLRWRSKALKNRCSVASRVRLAARGVTGVAPTSAAAGAGLADCTGYATRHAGGGDVAGPWSGVRVCSRASCRFISASLRRVAASRCASTSTADSCGLFVAVRGDAVSRPSLGRSPRVRPAGAAGAGWAARRREGAWRAWWVAFSGLCPVSRRSARAPGVCCWSRVVSMWSKSPSLVSSSARTRRRSRNCVVSSVCSSDSCACVARSTASLSAAPPSPLRTARPHDAIVSRCFIKRSVTSCTSSTVSSSAKMSCTSLLSDRSRASWMAISVARRCSSALAAWCPLPRA